MNEYILIQWPESQDYMDCDWFDDEAHLCLDISQAYFIHKKRYQKIMTDIKIIIEHIDRAYEHVLNTFPYKEKKSKEMLRTLNKLDEVQNELEELYN